MNNKRVSFLMSNKSHKNRKNAIFILTHLVCELSIPLDSGVLCKNDMKRGN